MEKNKDYPDVPDQENRASRAARVARLQAQLAQPKTDDGESRLDSLLMECEPPEVEKKTSEPSVSPMDRLRERMVAEFCPLIDDLHTKYSPRGIAVRMDIADFLAGRRGVNIAIDFKNIGLRLIGIVTDGGIAFQQTFMRNGLDGVITSGPMLRTRNLTSNQFRDFICEYIVKIVRAAERAR